jgi:acyl-CoA synthetase (AMP-forming)/AMP-acid ligase II
VSNAILKDSTVAAAFSRIAARYPGSDWLQVLPETAGIYGIEARCWQYREVAERVEQLRQAYARAGYGHGHRAGLLLLNRPEFLWHWLALNRLGVSIVPINPGLAIGRARVPDRAQRDQHRGDVARARGGSAAAAQAAGRVVGITGPGRRRHSAAVRAGAACRASSGTSRQNAHCSTPPAPRGGRKAASCRTSTFSGRVSGMPEIGGLCDVRLNQERMITPLPLTHMNALAYSAMCMMLTGGCLILVDRFHPGSWWDSVRASHATIIHYLGVMPAMLLGAEPRDSDRDLPVRFGFGAGVNARHHAIFEQRFGFPLLEAWAMTETGAGAVMIANGEPRQVGTACFGRAEAGIDCPHRRRCGCRRGHRRSG